MQRQQAQNSSIAIVLGVLGTIQYHLVQFTSRFDTVFGDRGDVRGVVYFCEHWYKWLLGKADLMSPAIFYPTKHTLAYSDLLLGYAVPYSVARLVGFGMFSSIEIVVILLTFLNYISCYVLLKHVMNFKMLPACAAAMFFAFSSPKFHQLPHLQLQYVLLLPLMFACVIIFVRKAAETGQREAAGWLTAAVLLWLLQATTAFYYAWFLVLWALLFAVFALLLTPSRRFIFTLARSNWRAIASAAVVLLVGFGLFVLVHLPGVRAGVWYSYENVKLMIPTWWSLLWMGYGNYLWGGLSAIIVPNPKPPTWNELMIGFGFIPTVAWLGITLWIIWRICFQNRAGNKTSVSGTTALLAAAVLATTLLFLIGFKFGNYSPWYLVYHYFPGGKAVRAVARYVIFLSLPMAIGFAFLLERATQWASEQRSKRMRYGLTAALVLLAGFGVFEQFGVFKRGDEGFSKKAEETYLNAMAAKLPVDCDAFYIAPGTGKHTTAEYQYDAMMISMMTGIPTLNASMSQFPRDWGLFFVHHPDYEASAKKWIELQGIKGKVCRLEIRPQIEVFAVRTASPLEDPEFVIRQHFRDLAGRESSWEEITPYLERLQLGKQPQQTCDPGPIALNLFRVTGFAEDGAFVYRTYQIGLGRAPTFQEFSSDLARLRNVSPADNKDVFVRHFVEREEFVKRYAGVSEGMFSDQLAENIESSLALASRLTIAAEGKSRTQILLDAVNDPQNVRRYSNRTFVALNYYGYLAREPDPIGFADWTRTLEQTGDLQNVTSTFLTSPEYRNRFAR